MCFLGCAAELGIAGVGHERRDRTQPVAVIDAKLLHDHAAHRHTEDVCGRPTDRVDHRDGIVGLIGQEVAAVGRGGTAGISIVKTYDIETSVV